MIHFNGRLAYKYKFCKNSSNISEEKIITIFYRIYIKKS